jgi:hypothetical protein
MDAGGVRMSKLLGRISAVVCLILVSACSTSEYSSTHDSADFPPEESLGDVVLTFDLPPVDVAPKLKASFSRKVLKPKIDFAGTYIFSVPYPDVEIDRDYFSIELSGEPISDRAWRFRVPRKAFWGEPAGITVNYLSDARQRESLILEMTEAENCLADYSLEDGRANVVRVSVSLQDGRCLLPCSPPLYPLLFCGNRWFPVK